MNPIAFPPAFADRAQTAPALAGRAPARAAEAPPTPEALKAAREFEAVFLRTLLAPLEKTTQLGSKSSMSAGQSTFGGMVVSTMADSMTNAGGIGLADVVARALSAHGAAEPR